MGRPAYWWYMLEVELAPQEAMTLCCESLSSLNKAYKLQTPSDPLSEIIVKTNLSWRGFGELVWLKVSKMPPPLVRIDVSSNPYCVDFGWDIGGNRGNVEGIIEFLISRTEPGQIARIVRLRPKKLRKGEFEAFAQDQRSGRQ